MEALKELFNELFFKDLAIKINEVDKNFDSKKFIINVCKPLPDLSLNQRMRHASQTLNFYLPHNYQKSISILKQVIPNINKGYQSLIFPDFVGLYGHADFETSMDALTFFTQFGSSEFAIREFLKRDFKKTIQVMETWALDKNVHIRRLASEGSRPRLPWSFKLNEVIVNPKVSQTILESLKTDTELYVKKSVANHLNDICKDNTDYMLSVLKRWDASNIHTQWIIKHASRTLIKKGNTESLSLFDFEKNTKIKIDNFKINKSILKLGDSLEFQFDIISEKKSIQKLAIDYVIHYVKKSGERSPKVFKLKELQLPSLASYSITKKQRLLDFSTRKHYGGEHVLSIQVNGEIKAELVFKLNV